MINWNIKERIALIVRKPKTALYTLLAVILIAAMSVGVTFTGCGSKDESGVSGANADGSETADGDVDKTGVSGGNIDKISDADATASGNIPGSYLPEGFWNLGLDDESENRYMDRIPICFPLRLKKSTWTRTDISMLCTGERDNRISIS